MIVYGDKAVHYQSGKYAHVYRQAFPDSQQQTRAIFGVMKSKQDE